MSTVGERLRYARENAKVTQEQAATYLDVSQTAICLWEDGQRKINLGALLQLAALYGCPEEYFDEDSEEEYTPIRVAMRGGMQITKDDLCAIANIKKLALNLREMDRILEG
jgi:transcriptional regulator with XRE-family HTH domain